MSQRHGVTEMTGDGLREAGVLVGVFGMLDKFVHGQGPTIIWTAAVLTISLFLFAAGCILERRRP
jgi:hypothetical protein